ncbi:MAG: hypothetical protein HWE22_10555 [Flavobacteriales bacterium]|nr:hypothetical protein [Flavobacteriales bacterium]
MKKILFAASLLMFVGAVGTTAYAASTSDGAQTEITKHDDKKKKKKKKKKADAKKSCSSESGKSCCSHDKKKS